MVFFVSVSFLLFVLDTSHAQICFKPAPIENAVLKPTHRDTEEFNDGAMIEYDCTPGYNIEGTSRERTCDSGIWSNIRFSCTLRTCPYVARPENGRRLDWNKGAGQYTHFVCNIGYKLKGPKQMLCLTNRKWMPSNAPICEPILCPDLRSIQYGRVSQTSGDMRNVYGSETVYKCNSGYLVMNTMVNRVTRRCQDDGSWSGEEPVCDVPRCETIQPFYGGKVTFLGGRKRWTQAFYICEDSYSPFPDDFDYSECSDDLEWTPPPPQCKKKSKAKIPKHGYKSRGNDILLHSDSYTLRCYNEYELYSRTFLDQSRMEITNINGTLTPEVPTCKEERCDPTDLFKAKLMYEDGTRARTKVLSRTNVHVSCEDRFEFYSTKDQSVNIRCLKGIFRRVPICREKRCLFSGYPGNVDTVHRNSDYSLLAPDARIRPQNKIMVSCRSDEYELYVNSTNTYLDEFATQCRYGLFDERKESFPICLEKRCLFTSTSDACFWINDDDSQSCKHGLFKIQSGTSVNLRCKNGYNLYRSEDGTSVKVTYNPVIVCNKGNYFAGYKCIPEQIIDELIVFAHKTVAKVGDIIDQSTCRFSIFGYSPFDSCKDPCIIPEVQNGFAKLEHTGDKVTHIVPHDNVITIQCNAGFKRSKPITSTCMFGEWDNEDWPHCTPNPCELTFHAGEMFWKDSKLLNANEGTKIVLANGTTIHLKCEGGYFLKDKTSGKSKYVDNKMKYSTCNLGRWTHNYACDAAPCTVPVVVHATLQSKAVKMYNNKEKAIFICDDGFHFQQTLSSTIIRHQSTCRLGNWTSIPGQCKPDSCNMALKLGSKYFSNVTNDEITTAGLIDHDTKIIIECLENYDLFDNKGNIIRDKDFDAVVVCDRGKWRNAYYCKQPQCTVPVVVHATLQSNAIKMYNNKEKATFICDDGFHFQQTLSSTIIQHESTCRLGNWTSIPGQCKPDSCNMALKLGSKYFSTETNDEITTAGLNDHDTKIIIECLENYDLFDHKGNIIRDKDFDAVVVCDCGKWRNAYYCKQQCVTFNVTHGRLMRGDEPVTSSENIAHGNQLSVECDSDTDLSDTITCDNGKWKNIPACTITAEQQQVTPVINISGCKLSGDARFTYTDEDYSDVAPGTMIAYGTNLSISCTITEMYDSYVDYYDTEDVIITCTGHGLSKPEIECPEFLPYTCLELEHGNVKKLSSYYEVSCDPGYSLNLLRPDKPQCECIGGVLKCTYGSQKPKCSPDHCVLPYDIDGRLSVINRFRVSLSGGSTVNIGDYVIFNCSKVNEQRYEPLNRRFKCENGQWLEDERDKEWKFGNNGEFPECREAICDPACENSGVCHKDDKCKCKHLTTGERCETVLCDPECKKNDGECIGPGVCGNCPVGQTGKNCDVFGCKIPGSAAPVLRPRLVYAKGETIPSSEFNCPDKHMLSSSNGMECLEDGIWSHKITCIKVLCDPECKKNDGECIGPGVCGNCPVGQMGKNCDVFGCKIPGSAAPVLRPRLVYAKGETIPSSEFNCPDKHMLSSSNGMECLEDGIWSHKITCIKEATYLIRVQTVRGNLLSGVGTSANVYIYLNGEDGSTNKINLNGPFTSGRLAEMRKIEKDIRPIKSVRIGHDGSGHFDSWKLEFVSVYVEDVDEYYVFRQQTASWVFEDNDLTLHLRNAFGETCMNTFRDKLTWYPNDWKSVNHVHLGEWLSERECKQRCTEQIQRPCIAVFYNSVHKNCFGFPSVDERYFKVIKEPWLSGFFIKNCI